MKKHGFTLAEVLITLGIIGVVAALTAPALVLNSRNQANAAKLSVTVSNLENAFTTALATENAETLRRTQMWRNVPLTSGSDDANIAQFVGNLGRYLHTNGYTTRTYSDANNAALRGYYSVNNTTTRMNENGSAGANDDTMANCFAINLKSGATVFMALTNGLNNAGDPAILDEDAIRAQGGSLFDDVADVFIDVNGTSAPNSFGRDIFRFYLGQDGILYPYGGMDVSIFDHNDRNHTWNGANAGNFRCDDAVKGNGNAGSGLGCTARLIENGYTMDY